MSSSNPVDGGQFSTREVVIAPYDPQWKNEFEKICAMIQSYIGEYLESIEHVGSTSVEGLGVTGEEFANGLLRAEKVAVVPGDAFGDAGRYHVRCSYATGMSSLDEATKRIARYIERAGR